MNIKRLGNQFMETLRTHVMMGIYVVMLKVMDLGQYLTKIRRFILYRSGISTTDEPPLLPLLRYISSHRYTDNDLFQRQQRADITIQRLSNTQTSERMREQQATCVICLEALTDAENVVSTSCPKAHVMHTQCLRSWLISNPSQTCPLCREPLQRENPSTVA